MFRSSWAPSQLPSAPAIVSLWRVLFAAFSKYLLIACVGLVIQMASSLAMPFFVNLMLECIAGADALPQTPAYEWARANTQTAGYIAAGALVLCSLISATATTSVFYNVRVLCMRLRAFAAWTLECGLTNFAAQSEYLASMLISGFM
jgi:hypothetical protein